MTPTSTEFAQPGKLGPGLYVHFPWCVKKCPYCDFNSHPLQGELDQDAYVQALIQDFQANAQGARFTSVFLGGGTPSLFSPQALATLLEAIGPQLAGDAEITMEANPGAVEHGAFAAYRQAGINRLSIGAQSFLPAMLKRLGRIHGPNETEQAFAEARQGGFANINLDLMYGLPNQRPQDALADLKRALALAPDHLSWYQLTIEPKTAFARRPPPTPGEEAIAVMETAGHALLAEAGLHRYEVSAYARPNAQCRHNLTYWTFGNYLGLGAGGESLQLGGAGASPAGKSLQLGGAGGNPTQVNNLQLGRAGGNPTQVNNLQLGRAGGNPTQVNNLQLGRAGGNPTQANNLQLGRAGGNPTQVNNLQLGRAGGNPTQANNLQLGRAGGNPTQVNSLQLGGAGASPSLTRFHKPRQPRLYLKDPTRSIARTISSKEVPGEFMMNALRLIDGVDRACFEQRTRLPWQQVAPIWATTTTLGLTQPQRIAATELGYRHLDHLIQFFL